MKDMLIAVTRRLPEACETRLSTGPYRARLGDDAGGYDRARIVRQAADADALIITINERLDAETIAALPRLKVISTVSVGFEHIDIAAARARKIAIGITPDVLTDATADVALLLLLGATRRAWEGERRVREGRWGEFRLTAFLGSQVMGKRLGIVGMGRIGRGFAARARACGMQILYHNRTQLAPEAADNATYCPTLDLLLAQSDVLSLHCPLTPETKGLLNADRLRQLPRGAVVLNTARGGLIDDDALIAAVEDGHIAAIGLDVFNGEPNIHPGYRTLENAMLLPHIGSGTVETRTAMGMLAIDNAEAVLRGGAPLHAVP